jgi:hypothetical protein
MKKFNQIIGSVSLAAATLAMAGQAQAFEKIWVPDGTDLWFEDMNWNPMAVPQFGDNAYILNGGTATVGAFRPDLEADNYYIGATIELIAKNGGSGHLVVDPNGATTAGSDVLFADSFNVGFVQFDGNGTIGGFATGDASGTARIVNGDLLWTPQQNGPFPWPFSVAANSFSAGPGNHGLNAGGGEIRIGVTEGQGNADGELELRGSLSSRSLQIGVAQAIDTVNAADGDALVTRAPGILALDTFEVDRNVEIGVARAIAFLDGQAGDATADGHANIKEFVDSHIGGDLVVGGGFIASVFDTQDPRAHATGRLDLERDVLLRIAGNFDIGVNETVDFFNLGELKGGMGEAYADGTVTLEGANLLQIGQYLRIGVGDLGEDTISEATGRFAPVGLDALVFGNADDDHGGSPALNNLVLDPETGPGLQVGVAMGDLRARVTNHGEFDAQILSLVDTGDGLEAFDVAYAVSDGNGGRRDGSKRFVTATATFNLDEVLNGGITTQQGVDANIGVAHANDSSDAVAIAQSFRYDEVPELFIGGDLNIGQAEATLAFLTNSGTAYGEANFEFFRIIDLEVNSDLSVGQAFAEADNRADAVAVGSFIDIENFFVGGDALLAVAEADDSAVATGVTGNNGEVLLFEEITNLDINGRTSIGLVTLLTDLPGDTALGVAEARVDFREIVDMQFGELEIGIVDATFSGTGGGNGIGTATATVNITDFQSLEIDGPLDVGVADAGDTTDADANGTLNIAMGDPDNPSLAAFGDVTVGEADADDFADVDATGTLTINQIDGVAIDGDLTIANAEAVDESDAMATGTVDATQIEGDFDVTGATTVGTADADDFATAVAVGNQSLTIDTVDGNVDLDGGLIVGDADADDFGQATADGAASITNVDGSVNIGEEGGVNRIGYADAEDSQSVDEAPHAAATGVLTIDQIEGDIDFGSEENSAGLAVGVVEDAEEQTTVTADGNVTLSNFEGVDHFGTLRIGQAESDEQGNATATGAVLIEDFNDAVDFAQDGSRTEIGVVDADDDSTAIATGSLIVQRGVGDSSAGVDFGGTVEVGGATVNGSSTGTAVGSLTIEDIEDDAGVAIGGDLIAGRIDALEAEDANGSATGTVLIQEVIQLGLNVDGGLQVGVANDPDGGLEATITADGSVTATEITGPSSIDGQLDIGVADANGFTTSDADGDASFTTMDGDLAFTTNGGEVNVGVATAGGFGSATADGTDDEANLFVEGIDGAVSIGNDATPAAAVNVGVATATDASTADADGAATFGTDETNGAVNSFDQDSIDTNIGVASAQDNGTATAVGDFDVETINSSIDNRGTFQVGVAAARDGDVAGNGSTGSATAVGLSDIAGVDGINIGQDLNIGLALLDSAAPDSPLAADATGSLTLDSILALRVRDDLHVGVVLAEDTNADVDFGGGGGQADALGILIVDNFNSITVDDDLFVGTADNDDQSTGTARGQLTAVNGGSVAIGGNLEVGRSASDDFGSSNATANAFIARLRDANVTVADGVEVGEIDTDDQGLTPDTASGILTIEEVSGDSDGFTVELNGSVDIGVVDADEFSEGTVSSASVTIRQIDDGGVQLAGDGVNSIQESVDVGVVTADSFGVGVVEQAALTIQQIDGNVIIGETDFNDGGNLDVGFAAADGLASATVTQATLAIQDINGDVRSYGNTIRIGVADAESLADAAATATAQIDDVDAGEPFTGDVIFNGNLGDADSGRFEVGVARADGLEAVANADGSLQVGQRSAIDGEFRIGSAGDAPNRYDFLVGVSAATGDADAVAVGDADIINTADVNIYADRFNVAVATVQDAATSDATGSLAIEATRGGTVNADRAINFGYAVVSGPAATALPQTPTATATTGDTPSVLSGLDTIATSEDLRVGVAQARGIEPDLDGALATATGDLAISRIESLMVDQSIEVGFGDVGVSESGEVNATGTLDLTDVSTFDVTSNFRVGRTSGSADTVATANGTLTTEQITLGQIGANFDIGTAFVTDSSLATVTGDATLTDSIINVGGDLNIGYLSGGGTNNANTADGSLKLFNSLVNVTGVTRVGEEQPGAQGTATGTLNIDPSGLVTGRLSLDDDATLIMDITGDTPTLADHAGVFDPTGTYSVIHATENGASFLDGALEVIFKDFIPDLTGVDFVDFDIITSDQHNLIGYDDIDNPDAETVDNEFAGDGFREVTLAGLDGPGGLGTLGTDWFFQAGIGFEDDTPATDEVYRIRIALDEAFTISPVDYEGNATGGQGFQESFAAPEPTTASLLLATLGVICAGRRRRHAA